MKVTLRGTEWEENDTGSLSRGRLDPFPGILRGTLGHPWVEVLISFGHRLTLLHFNLFSFCVLCDEMLCSSRSGFCGCWVSWALERDVFLWLAVTGDGDLVEKGRGTCEVSAADCKCRHGGDLLFLVTNYAEVCVPWVFDGWLSGAIVLLKYFHPSTLCQHLKDITFLCGSRKIRK